MLFGYGASAINPYLVNEVIELSSYKMVALGDISLKESINIKL